MSYVGHLTLNQRVASSSLASPTIYFKGLAGNGQAIFISSTAIVRLFQENLANLASIFLLITVSREPDTETIIR